MKKENGISLITLSVTLLVLLIITSTVLHFAFSNGGIFDSTHKNIEETAIGTEKEQLYTMVEQVLNDNVIDGYGSVITLRALYNSAKEVVGYNEDGSLKVIVSKNDSGDIEFTFRESKRKYIITTKGEIDENYVYIEDIGAEEDLFNGVKDASDVVE